LALLITSVVQAEPLQQATGEAILTELKAMRETLERIEKNGGLAVRVPKPSGIAAVSIKDRQVLGAPDAPVTLVEFTDFQCPYCVRFTKTSFAQLKAAFVDTGKLRIVVKNTPLVMHANARKAAQASLCAGDQGAYWPMHMKLFDNAKQLGETFLPGYAAELKLDVEAFAACLASDRHLNAIASDSKEAQAAGISGTPTFVLGASNGDMVQGEIIRGSLPFEAFQGKIMALLKKQVDG
jgi:protein-disulfide isomerase